MCKNSGNIGYFQKNKKTVLSLITTALLSGSVVIGGIFSNQEIADVNTKPSDEKPRISPHIVDLQDKLSQIKPEFGYKPMALVSTNGWVSLGKIGNYDVKYRSFGISSGYIYQFIGTYGTSQLGFGCICANINGTQTWKGMIDSQCYTSASPDNPLDLGDGIMGSYSISGIPIPSGACCKSVPRVDSTSIPGVSCP
ncbi:hypothetical protein [Methylobacter sp. YRD-M1]|uniref:hypothetical protein n=1 Tax=Methylobacter sp. YRD-M1 TaxID=2911520 RepID=UPI00227AD353|nr:hypothetical protein [Methylobacter sp. YRD-M1]WAK01040.1 hypothetical protein LZ558_14505 [Methylobacter sp. YRD-M1]